MADKSKIEWTDATWSPVTGCDPISPGCKNCYAKREVEQRWSKNPKSIFFGRAFNDVQCHPSALEQPLHWKNPRRIFVCPRSDLFHPAIPYEWIAAVFGVMALARHHTFQVLTKRPERMRAFFSWLAQQTEHKSAWVASVNHAEFICGEPKGKRGAEGDPIETVAISAYYDREVIAAGGCPHGSLTTAWPLPNVWLGVTAENQETADERIPILLDTPAAVRWVSVEPVLGPVNLRRIEHSNYSIPADAIGGIDSRGAGGLTTDIRPGATLDWVVVGGESGPNARPMHPAWVRSLRDQCDAAGVPFLFKQWGEWLPTDADDQPVYRGEHRYLGDRWHAFKVGKKAAGRLLDGVLHDGYPEVRP